MQKGESNGGMEVAGQREREKRERERERGYHQKRMTES